MTENNRDIGKSFFFIPFGRFTSGEEAPPPYDEVLIGRESHRQSLVADLIRMGPRGAFLVTGRRGMGKTMFVRYCLKKYTDNIYGRHIRGDKGKSVADMVAYALIFCLFGLAALLVEDLIVLTIGEKLNHMDSGMSLPRWILISFLTAIFVYPIAYASKLVNVSLRLLSKGPSIIIKILTPYIKFSVVAILLLFINRIDPGKYNDSTEKKMSSAFTFMADWTNGFHLNAYIPMATSLVIGGIFLILLTLYGSIIDNRIVSRPRKVGSVAAAAILFGACIYTYFFIISVDSVSDLSMPFFIHCVAICAFFNWMLRYAGTRQLQISNIIPTPGIVFVNIGIVLILIECMSLAYFGDTGVGGGKNWRYSNIWKSSYQYFFANVSIVFMFWFYFKILSEWTCGGSGAEINNEQTIAFRMNERMRMYVMCWRPAILLIAKSFILILLTVQLASPIVAITFRSFDIQTDTTGLFFGGDLGSSGNPQHYGGRWFLGFVCLCLGFSFFEFKWILRDRQLVREAEKQSNWKPWLSREEQPVSNTQNKDRDFADLCRKREWLACVLGYSIERLTFPWHFLSNWLPSLVVEVNLGLNRLTHTEVIRSMLIGMRQRYYERFVAWNAPSNLIGTFLLVIILFEGVQGVDQILLNPKVADEASVCQVEVDKTVVGEPGVKLRRHLCNSHETIASFIYAPVLKFYEKSDGAYVMVLPVTIEKSSFVGFRVYHLIIFIILTLIILYFHRRWHILPYKSHLQRIEVLLDSLSGSTKSRRERRLAPYVENFVSIISPHESRETEISKADGRSVELSFLSLLEDIQRDSLLNSHRGSLGLSIPAPEFTFVFDELDKLGENRNADQAGASATPKSEASSGTVTPDQELKRSQDILKLLADMKRILSCNNARFIFVGGRMLYDEWLADQVARVPLLNSIFDSQIYLPSFLVDIPFTKALRDRHAHDMENGVWQLLAVQKARADYMFHRWIGLNALPVIGHPRIETVSETFVSKGQMNLIIGSDYKDSCFSALSPVYLYRPWINEPGPITAVAHGEPRCEILIEDFTRFLTYRSAGNPMRMRDLLASFVRRHDQVGITLKPDSEYKFYDVLRFADMELCRIQFTSDVFDCLVKSFQTAIAVRDDKVAESLFFFSDFLFKFHRRAFNLANLERIDELEHIHRAPDVRELFWRIVEEFSQRYLHAVPNGMYDYRFRSDIAREIDYISKVSPQDMAAFNFTLNESQTLKEIYLDEIRDNQNPNIDIIAGLGELYDHEQEYDRARHYYRRAIDSLDANAPSWMSTEIKTAMAPGTLDPTLDLRWAIIRLRFMLQIAMTFEQSSNFERAEAQYRSAYVLAWNVLRSYVKAGKSLFIEEHAPEQHDTCAPEPAKNSPRGRSHFLHVLKHLNLLYQPAFAIAWVAEKQLSDVDSSAAFIEKELLALRTLLPGLQLFPNRLPNSAHEVLNSNFRLIAAELHAKAGDLYLMKGRQFVTVEQILGNLNDPVTSASRFTGYQLRAHHHYATSLHEIRNYNWYRVMASARKLNICGEDGKTMEDGDGPFFINISAANTLTNISATIFARLSIFTLLKDINDTPENWKPLKNHNRSYRSMSGEIALPLDRWLMLSTDGSGREKEHRPPEIPMPFELGHGLDISPIRIGDWLGNWQYALDENQECKKCRGKDRDRCVRDGMCVKIIADPVRAGGHNSTAERLLFSLHVLLIGGIYSEKASAIELSAERMLQVSRNVSTLFWWLLTIKRFDLHNVGGKTLPDASCVTLSEPSYWTYIFNLGVEALSEARRLYRERSSAAPKSRTTLRDRDLPAIMTQACNLALLAVEFDLGNVGIGLDDRVRELFEETTTGFRPDDSHGFGQGIPANLREKVKILETLRNIAGFYRFPVLNRLNILKIIADSISLSIQPLPETVFSRDANSANEVDELRDLAARYGSKIHFTPIQLGHTVAIYALQCIGQGADRGNISELQFAREELNAARESFTMGRQYYHSIGSLFYLNDDFNDHDLIFGHALQMASCELISVLLEKIKE